MHDWLLAWYNVDYTPMPMSEMMDDEMSSMNHEGMPATDPTMMMGMMAGLNHLEGVEYEIGVFCILPRKSPEVKIEAISSH